VTTILEIGLSNALMASVLALAAFAVSRLWRRPALAHALWLLVLIKLITPPLFPVAMPWPMTVELAAVEAPPHEPPPLAFDWRLPLEDGELAATSFAGAPLPPPMEPLVMPVAGEAVVVPPPSTLTETAFDWTPLLNYATAGLLLIWLAGSLGWFTLLAYRIGKFQRLLRFAVPASRDVQDHAAGLARKLGLDGSPTLWMVPGAVSPMLWGILGRPRLLIPEALWKDLDWSQRGALLTHELAHFKRRDHWVRGLELVVTGLYWWHPVVWWARHELREAEEQCCDAWVLWALPAAAKSYARALVSTLDFLSEAAAPLPVPASGFGHVHHLKRRLTMILRGSTPRALTWAGGLCVLGLAAMLLPLGPTWGQPQPPREQPGGEKRREDPKPREGDRRPEADRRPDERRPEGGGDLQEARREIERLRDQLRRAEERLEGLAGRKPDGKPDAPRPSGDRKPDGPPMGGDRKPDAPMPPRGGGFGGGFGGPGGGGGFGGGPGFGGAGGGFGGGGGGFPGMPGGDLERRLGEVERKLERLMEMIEKMKPGTGPGGPGGPGAGPGGPGGPGIRREGDRPNPPMPPRREGDRERKDGEERRD
jgi:beta-lactamase regulating signal transducer with metallopeptidase domain